MRIQGEEATKCEDRIKASPHTGVLQITPVPLFDTEVKTSLLAYPSASSTTILNPSTSTSTSELSSPLLVLSSSILPHLHRRSSGFTACAPLATSPSPRTKSLWTATASSLIPRRRGR
eukprot:748590-Hanusia_phi.AAC.4